MSSSQLTFLFFRGVAQTTNQICLGIPSSQLVVDGSVSAEEIWFKPQVAAGVQIDFHQSRLDSTSLNMVQEMVMLRWLQGRDAAGSLLNQPNMGAQVPRKSTLRYTIG